MQILHAKVYFSLMLRKKSENVGVFCKSRSAISISLLVFDLIENKFDACYIDVCVLFARTKKISKTNLVAKNVLNC